MSEKSLYFEYEDGIFKGMVNDTTKMNSKEVVELLNYLNNEVQSQTIVIKEYQKRNDELFQENLELKEVNKFLKSKVETYKKSSSYLRKLLRGG